MREPIAGTRRAFTCFALLACALRVSGYERVFPSPRVILGREVDQFNVSFYCTLFVEFASDAGTSLCGCVVHSPGVVLSAGHCFQKDSDDGSGVKDFFTAAHVRLYGQTHSVSAALTKLVNTEVFIHPQHSSLSLRNDIAVFYLPMDSSTASVTLNQRDMDWENLGPTDRLTVVGIGRTEKGVLSMEYNSEGRIDPLSLGLPRESALSRRSCSDPVGYGELKPWPLSVTYGDICTGPFNPCVEGRCADSCQGDSGGPMYMRARDSPDGVTKLFGIVSRGYKCGIAGGYPGIYSPVHDHLKFIEKYSGRDAVHETVQHSDAITSKATGVMSVMCVYVVVCMWIYIM